MAVLTASKDVQNVKAADTNDGCPATISFTRSTRPARVAISSRDQRYRTPVNWVSAPYLPVSQPESKGILAMTVAPLASTKSKAPTQS